MGTYQRRVHGQVDKRWEARQTYETATLGLTELISLYYTNVGSLQCYLAEIVTLSVVNGTNIIVLHQCRLLTMLLSRDCDFIGCYLNSKTRAGLNSSKGRVFVILIN